MDLVEIDAASNRGIDAIRELRERINYAPTDLRRKVYILDEAHQITKDAWNALLKSLEEPPDFVVFMFASTHPQEFPPAILSRLQRFDVRRLTTDEIEGKLRRILEADGRTATPEAVHLIARLAAGGMRDAESMLDQLLSSSADELDEARVRDLLGLADAETVGGFVDALVATDALAGMRLLDGLEERGRDLRGFLDQVIEALRAAIVGAARRSVGRDGRRRTRRRRARRGGAAPRRDRPEPRRRRRPPPPARARAVPGTGRRAAQAGPRALPPRSRQPAARRGARPTPAAPARAPAPRRTPAAATDDLAAAAHEPAAAADDAGGAREGAGSGHEGRSGRSRSPRPTAARVGAGEGQPPTEAPAAAVARRRADGRPRRPPRALAGDRRPDQRSTRRRSR